MLLKILQSYVNVVYFILVSIVNDSVRERFRDLSYRIASVSFPSSISRNNSFALIDNVCNSSKS